MSDPGWKLAAEAAAEGLPLTAAPGASAALAALCVSGLPSDRFLFAGFPPPKAGARRAAWVLLRLPYQVKDLFLDWLSRHVHPERAKKVESLIRQSRGGKLYRANDMRGRGQGAIAEQLSQNFDVFTRRYGLNRDVRALSSAHFRRPDLSGQLGLFEQGG